MSAEPDRPFQPPFLIVGCVRSGTTMLRDLLRRHPNLVSPEETHFFRSAEPFGTHGFVHFHTTNPTLRKHRAIDQITEDEFATMLAETNSRAALCWRYMTTFAARRKPDARRWFDKTPQNVYGVHLAAVEMPHARFVHIVRDPVNVVASLRIGKVMKVESLVGACAYWNEAAEILAALKRAYPNRLLEVRYEDVVANPLEHVRQVLEFVGEPFDPAHFAGVATRPIDHRDEGVLSPTDIETVQRLCAVGRERYGYLGT